VHIVSSPPPPPAPKVVTIAPFAEGSYALSAKLLKEIQRMALTIQKSHYMTITLAGYTDNVFTPAFNVTLNQNRAQAVLTRLSQDLKTLKDSKVSITIVLGSSVVLAANNATAKGRAQNRRVVATLKAT
jgi:outer membrane protein OmpA-like peptidoglycan-associated protein